MFTLKESADYSLESIRSMKGDRPLFVIFSTFGEREADLIYDKISLLKNELGGVVDRFYLSHRRRGDAQERTEKMARQADEHCEILICNTFPVPDMDDERGKGADMRRTLYHINDQCSSGPDEPVLVFLDADVVPEHFGSHFVLGLAGAVLEGNDFAKASFWRAMGRVKKFVAQPLFSVLAHEDLEPLQRMHYPLSGEVAGTLRFFNSVSFWQIYGVETGINVDALMNEYSVADVNLGLYDHEHHSDVNIQKMCFGIMRTYLKQLETYGFIELKKGMTIADDFRASYIDDQRKRRSIDFNLEERKYQPLTTILK